MRRDIIKALRAIGERKARLANDGGAELASPDAATITLDAAMVRNMVSEGLLRRVRGEVTRTAEGRAYLRRALSGAGSDADAFAAQHRVTVAPPQPPRPHSRSGTQTRKSATGAASATHAMEAPALVNAAESPLAWLATRRDRSGTPMISSDQYEAGKRLATDYDRGHQREQVTQSWNVSGVRGEAPRDRLTVSEAARAARARVERALAAVGPDLNELLVSVCCEEIGLEAVEKRRGWPARSAKVVLRLALDRLAAHYGISGEARGPSTARLVHWGAADYCPPA